MTNPFSLENKVVLVTGASSGIGQSVAIECSRMGAHLIITARDDMRLQETFELLQGEGHIKITADLKNHSDIQRILEISPSINGIVHSAGVNNNKPFLFASPEALNDLMLLNFFAPVELTRLFVKEKRLLKGSSVVFISSVSGVYCSAPASSMYSASKGAVNGVAKGMALDLATKQIRVNTITPGVVETNIFGQGMISDKQLEENKQNYPLKRFGKPVDIAYASIYLLSDASNWVTGTNLLIDGGLTLL